MVNITKESYENNDIETITDKLGKLWLNKNKQNNNQDIKIYQQLQTNTTKNIKNADMK